MLPRRPYKSVSAATGQGALVTRLRQLTQLRTAQRNQRRLVEDPVVQAGFGHLLAISHGRSRIADQIAALIHADPRRPAVDAAGPGLPQPPRLGLPHRRPTDGRNAGDRRSAQLKPSPGSPAWLPLANDSGKHQGKRRVRGGRSSVRQSQKGQTSRNRLTMKTVAERTEGFRHSCVSQAPRRKTQPVRSWSDGQSAGTSQRDSFQYRREEAVALKSGPRQRT